MSEFVLVHGSWIGGWAWERVAPLLTASGHRVHMIDLPGSGTGAPPVPAISLQAYADHALEAIDSASGPPVLVGHSMGGIVVSTAAERGPAPDQSNPSEVKGSHR